MNNQVHSISQALVKKTIDECSITELRQLAQQYPYYTPVHLLLTAKLKLEKDETAHREYQKTSLYFHNVPWLDYLLSGPTTVVKSAPAQNKSDFDDAALVETVEDAALDHPASPAGDEGTGMQQNNSSTGPVPLTEDENPAVTETFQIANQTEELVPSTPLNLEQEP